MWKGILLAPVTYEYIFYFYCYANCKVKIGNELIIDGFSKKHIKGTIALESGKYYDLSVEIEINRLKFAKLTWKYPGQTE
jgi:hypothetical protein